MKKPRIAIVLACALVCITLLNSDKAHGQCDIQSIGLLGRLATAGRRAVQLCPDPAGGSPTTALNTTSLSASSAQGDDINGSPLNPTRITIDADKEVTAVFEIIPLTRILLLEPANGAACYAPPQFWWVSGAGTDTVFSVDLSLNYEGPFYSMWELFGFYTTDENWIMPYGLWQKFPSGSFIYWRVRGVDRDAARPTTIFSNEVWWFYKP